MTVWTLNLGRPLDRLRRSFGRRPGRAALEAAARVGYLARGAVYFSVGLIALLAALRMTPHAQGALGALEAWGAWPLGLAMLWAVGLGLYAFAGWRALQALFDVDRCGRTLRGLASRAGQILSGLTYGGLAVSLFGLIDAIEDLREADDRAGTQAFVASLLALPLGPTLVIGAGLAIVALGAGNLVRAAVDHFGRGLDCREDARVWAGALARFGYGARGVALMPAGAITIQAGWHARAAEASGLGGALDLLAEQPLGHLALGVTALGLMAFGAFAVVEGALRRIRMEAVV